ncbi:MAG: sodium-dependent transporter [Gammaproteobacteria bacterium]|nr:sodium-dependent transporter [Gammaproteobacteria bacterium]
MAAAGGGHEQWSSRFGFLMASVGFAVGLGNIWRFPYIAGENGGAAFVLVYLICAVGIGVPILMAELLVGRRGKMSPPKSMRIVAEAGQKSCHWQWVGGMGLLAAFTIEVVYAAIVGWVLWYLFKAVTTGFTGVDADMAEAQFTAVLADPIGMVFWTLVGLAITGLIVYAGVRKGIERTVTVLMPMLFALLGFLAIYNIFAGGMAEAIAWLFTPDFSKITPTVFLAAIGQAFFSIGVAMGGMMTFGAYLPKDVSIPKSVIIIVIADTGVALLAGLVIFPAVFNNGLDPAAGVGLIFQTLPVAFAQMPGGYLFSILFFLLLAVAGITSMVGLIECVIAWMEDHYGFTRHHSAMMVVGSVAVLSVLSVLSYNVLSDYQMFGRDLNGVLDYFSNQILLPVGGFLIAFFVGWFVHKQVSSEELAFGNPMLFKLWHFLIRFVVPPAVLIIFVMGVSE